MALAQAARGSSRSGCTGRKDPPETQVRGRGGTRMRERNTCSAEVEPRKRRRRLPPASPCAWGRFSRGRPSASRSAASLTSSAGGRGFSALTAARVWIRSCWKTAPLKVRRAAKRGTATAGTGFTSRRTSGKDLGHVPRACLIAAGRFGAVAGREAECVRTHRHCGRRAGLPSEEHGGR